MATPMLRAAMTSSSLRASASVGVGASSTLAGSTRSGRSYSRAKSRGRRTPTMWPRWKRCSSTRRPSSQSHHGPFLPTRWSRSAGRDRTAVADAGQHLVDEAGLLTGEAVHPLRRACRSIRQRNRRCWVLGTMAAMWAQYSHSSPSSMASASIVRLWAPRRANSGSSWLRTSTFTASSWTTLIRSNTRRRWRRSTRPLGRVGGSPGRRGRSGGPAQPRGPSWALSSSPACASLQLAPARCARSNACCAQTAAALRRPDPRAAQHWAACRCARGILPSPTCSLTRPMPCRRRTSARRR